jgi:hypothetical protein
MMMVVIGAIIAIEIGLGYLAMKTLNPANESSPIFWVCCKSLHQDYAQCLFWFYICVS